ncbi:MAG: hypothetical protein U1B78_08275 [Dehalococcoidia bacterium]|nr:hypothetical protein [Dehalococcoidia bacterium]
MPTEFEAAREALVAELADAASRRLAELGCANVRVYTAGEELGWSEQAPYDAIIVTAGAPIVPSSLVDQLAMGGRLVVPVGGRRLQQLVRATNSERGLTIEKLGECRFVPLIAPEGGWPDEGISENGAQPFR